MMLLGFSCWFATTGCGGGSDSRPDVGDGLDAGSIADSGTPDAVPNADSGAPDAAPDAAPATHNFTLATAEVRLRQRFGFSAPADAHVFIDVKLMLKNTGEAQPLSVSPFRFSLKTTDALIYSNTGLGSSLPKACPTNVSLAISDARISKPTRHSSSPPALTSYQACVYDSCLNSCPFAE
jgi:hypothetical protein